MVSRSPEGRGCVHPPGLEPGTLDSKSSMITIFTMGAVEDPTGLEPVTTGSKGRRSYRLSYRSMFLTCTCIFFLLTVSRCIE